MLYELKTIGGKLVASGMFDVRDSDRPFGTGNHGWFTNDKTAISKQAHAAHEPVVITIKDGDSPVATFTLSWRKFSSGSWGYWGGGKVFTPYGETQTQAQLVLLGSKGLVGDADIKALNNRYQFQAQMVLLNGVKLTTVSEAAEDAINAIDAAA